MDQSRHCVHTALHANSHQKLASQAIQNLIEVNSDTSFRYVQGHTALETGQNNHVIYLSFSMQ